MPRARSRRSSRVSDRARLELREQLARLRGIAFDHALRPAEAAPRARRAAAARRHGCSARGRGARSSCALDDPPARLPKVFDQADVAQHEARLRSHVADQLLLRRVHRIVCGRRDGERTQELTLVFHLERLLVAEVRKHVRPNGHARRDRGSRRARRPPRASRRRCGARPARSVRRSPHRGAAPSAGARLPSSTSHRHAR